MNTPAEIVTALHAELTEPADAVATLRSAVLDAPSAAAQADAATRLRAARDAIQRQVGAIDPATLAAGVATDVPIALLPVRLETRFGDPGANDVLHVRIFPDDIHVDGHDEALTVSESDLGTALWAAPDDTADPGAESPAGRRARWAALVHTLGGPRAVWVARATAPGTVTPTTKPVAYRKPAVARALPDRWLVRGYIGAAVVAEAWSGPVRSDLHLTPDPAATTDAAPANGQSGPAVDAELTWLTDYAAALAAGMAVDVALPPGTDSLDRVVAVGVRASLTPGAGADELAALLEAHHYVDGTAFLVPGTPTSNTPAARSGYDRSGDPDALWQQEFATGTAHAGIDPATTAGGRTAAALGLRPGVLAGADGATTDADGDAKAMQTATWAATWGHFLTDLLDSVSAASVDVSAVRDHYLAHVRGGGTLPTVRFGHQPYGLLPVVRLAHWQASGASTTVTKLAALLNRVRPLWAAGVQPPVTAETGTGFDAAFTAAMSMDAVARRYAVRSVVGDRTIDPSVFGGLAGLGVTATGVADALVASLLGTTENPLLFDVFAPNAEPVRAPLVVDPRDPTPDDTVHATITALAATDPTSVLTDVRWLRPTPTSPATVLHTLLRRSLLLEYAAAGQALSVLTSASTSVQLRTLDSAEMLLAMAPDTTGGFAPVSTAPSLLMASLGPITSGLPTAQWLWHNPSSNPASRRTLDDTLAALERLATMTADQLSLLLPETLDLASHRYTAWAESIAAEALSRARAATPTGITLGGWGAVERLTRQSRLPVEHAVAGLDPTTALWTDPNPGGFVLAPSPAQAATASVLRAAHLAHGGDADAAFAIDLSSGRTRVALRLADGVRGGQELGALLGYELESALHDRHADVLVAGLRAYAPRYLASGTFVTAGEGVANETSAAAAVCDGLSLATASPSEVAAHVLPAGASSALASALSASLAELADHLDSLADLLTAESVHHALTGNTARASAALDAAHRGAPPPDSFDVVRTPRPGSGLTCRVTLMLPAADDSSPLPGGWPQSPRGAADPALNRWLAGMLPPFASVRLRLADRTGVITDWAVPESALLGPIDVVLDRPEAVRARLTYAAPQGSTLDGIRPATWAPQVVSLAELLTVATDLRELVARTALRRGQLVGGAGPSTTATPDERDLDDLHRRYVEARAAVESAVASNDVLAACAVGISAPDPAVTSSADALSAAAAELHRRLITAPASDASADDLAAGLRDLFGAEFPALPRFALDADTATALGAALARGDGYLEPVAELAADWVDDTASVRPALGRAAAALHGCTALGGPRTLTSRWRIVETAPTSTWSATCSADVLAALAPVTAAVCWLDDSAELTEAALVTGVVVDQWSEIVPSPTAAPSIAYQADAPTARAGQAILLGLPADPKQGWDVDGLAGLVLEALDLAALRSVDAEQGAWLGRMLPAIVLPDGDATDVIAAPPLPLLQVDETVLLAGRLQAKELG